MIELLITLLILLVIFAVIWWVLTLIPLPPPMNWIAQVVVAIIFLICLVSFLLPNLPGRLVR